MAKYTLADLGLQFPDDDACLAYLFEKRYGQHGPACPCGKRDSYHRVQGRKSYACAWCGRQISPTAGTIFDHSPTPLTLWFFAMFLMCSSRNGVAALELKRQLGVTYKTAWRMAHSIRQLMRDDTDPDKLKGVVEGDETYVGGKRSGGKRGRGALGKTPVVGFVERGGRVRAHVINRVTTAEVFRFLYRNIEVGSTLYTDELAVYNYAQRWGFEHEHVKHRRWEYVRGEVHANTIEGFWSQLKRSIDGTHHQVSRRWLHLYVAEQAWRYSRRRAVRPMLLSLLDQAAKALPPVRAA
jgi:transposase-like protein